MVQPQYITHIYRDDAEYGAWYPGMVERGWQVGTSERRADGSITVVWMPASGRRGAHDVVPGNVPPQVLPTRPLEAPSWSLAPYSPPGVYPRNSQYGPYLPDVFTLHEPVTLGACVRLFVLTFLFFAVVIAAYDFGGLLVNGSPNRSQNSSAPPRTSAPSNTSANQSSVGQTAFVAPTPAPASIARPSQAVFEVAPQSFRWPPLSRHWNELVFRAGYGRSVLDAKRRCVITKARATRRHPLHRRA
jgi:hypothetical protein